MQHRQEESRLGTGTSYTTPSISTTTTYYVDATSGTCTTATRTAVIATVNALPTAPTQNVDCSLGFGQAVVNVTGPLGAGYEYRLDAGHISDRDIIYCCCQRQSYNNGCVTLRDVQRREAVLMYHADVSMVLRLH